MGIVEKAQQLYEPGVPHQIPLPEESLFSLLREAAQFYPERVAVDFLEATTTYQEILSQSLRAAQVLVDAGVKKGDVVALVLPNCPQAFVAFYACMRIGAVAAWHNPLAPAGELAGQFSRHRATVAVIWEKSIDVCPLEKLDTVFAVDLSAGLPSRDRFLLRLPVKAARKKREELRAEVPAEAVSWDRAVEAATELPEAYPHAEVEDPAVILHTGGTNGVPKSVPLTHRNIGANVNQNIFWVYQLNQGAEVFFSLLPYFHAFGLTFLLCAAVKKAATQLVLPKFDVKMALAAHRRRNVTFFVGVPPMFDRIAQAATSDKPVDLHSIRYAVSGAMPLPETVAALWQRATGGLIIEGYGLSETAPVISGAPLAPSRRLGVLGLPFPSTQVRLVDWEDPSRDVADGEPGEIIVKGPQVFSGYLDDPAETARAFTADGWFRTGDIAVSEDGYLTLADRRKELILCGGFNVYPSQVEAAIKEMRHVEAVAVVGMPLADGSEEVTAVIVRDVSGAKITLEDVREWAVTIPHYALPRRLEFIEEMPRNMLGKIQRRVLKEQLIERERHE